MISVITPIGAMRGDEVSNQRTVDNFAVMQRCFYNQNYEDKKLIVVEQKERRDDIDRFDIDKRTHHIQVYGVPFCAPWLMNIGARMSIGDLLVFIEADVVFDDVYLSDIADVMSMSSAFYMYGWNRSLWLNEEGRSKFMEAEKYDALPPAEYIDRTIVPHVLANSGLSIIVQRWSFFNTLGGWNETFVQCSGYDNDFAFRAEVLIGKLPQLDRTILHLCHEGRVYGTNNYELWEYTQQNPERVIYKILDLGVGQPDAPRRYKIYKGVILP